MLSGHLVDYTEAWEWEQGRGIQSSSEYMPGHVKVGDVEVEKGCFIYTETCGDNRWGRGGGGKGRLSYSVACALLIHTRWDVQSISIL